MMYSSSRLESARQWHSYTRAYQGTGPGQTGLCPGKNLIADIRIKYIPQSKNKWIMLAYNESKNKWIMLAYNEGSL